MNQMYIDEPFSTSTGMNLFCREFGLTKQILKAGIPLFNVHRSTSVHLIDNFSHSLAVLMNQMYIDVLQVVYGDFFAMGILSESLMYFSTGNELHRSTFGSSIRRRYGRIQ